MNPFVQNVIAWSMIGGGAYIAGAFGWIAIDSMQVREKPERIKALVASFFGLLVVGIGVYLATSIQ